MQEVLESFTDFLTIQEQANEVLKVKRSGSVMIENPYSISPDKSIDDA